VSDFTRHFREHVPPHLRRLAAYHGLCVALDLESWVEAQAAVTHHALTHGALALPAVLADDLLTDWIPTQLLAAITAVEPVISAAEGRAAAVAAQMRHHWRAFNAAS
jgi:hypothetical protein